jgi:hypothetical protein
VITKIIWALIILSGIGFYLWAEFAGDDWLAEFNSERQQAAAEFIAKGEAEGKLKTDQACFDDAIGQIAECLSISCTVDAGQYLRGCWGVAERAEGFCDGVPEFQEEKTEEEKEWARFACYDLNSRGDGCRLLMRQKQQHCATQ